MPPAKAGRGRGRGGSKNPSRQRAPAEGQQEEAAAGPEAQESADAEGDTSAVGTGSSAQEREATARSIGNNPASASATEAQTPPEASATPQRVSALREAHDSSSSPSARGQPARRSSTPRNITRRSKEQRDAIAHAELAKARQLNAEQASERERERQKQERIANRKRGWSSNANLRGRGRGGFMGLHGQGTGAFSLGSAVTAKAKQWRPHSKMGAYKKSTPWDKVKEERGREEPQRRADEAGGPSKDAEMVDIKDEDVYDIDTGDDDDDDGDDDVYGEGKKDIDYINLVSDEEDGDGNGPSLFPIRVKQTEHSERALDFAPEQTARVQASQQAPDEDNQDEPAVSAAKRKDKQRAKDVEIVETRRPWRGVFDDPNEQPAQIKKEPTDDVHSEGIQTAVDAAITGRATPPAAEQQPRPKKDKARRRSDSLAKKPEFTSREEEREYDLRASELETIVQELGHVDVGDSANGVPTSKMDALYLFQFPPVLPDLMLATDKVKLENSDNDVAVQSEHVDLTKDAKGKGKSTATASDPSKPEIKQEIKADPDVPPSTARPPGFVSGNIGKMRVHRSGKVTFDWGGTSMQVNLGMQAGFYEDAVLVQPYGANQQPGAPSGEAKALGPVKGKFVVTPDWDELF